MTLTKAAIDAIVSMAKAGTTMGKVRLIRYVESLSFEEKAELMALMWLGRDGGLYRQQLVQARTLTNDTVGLYLSEQGAMLSTYLNQGVQNMDLVK